MEDKIFELLKERNYYELKQLLNEMQPFDLALLLDDMPKKILPLVFRLLGKELAAETFVEMETDAQEHLIEGFSDNELKEVLNELYVDDTVDIIEEMPANVVKRILANSEASIRKMINEILKYPEDSTGSIMTTEYISLRRDMTVEEALKRIRRTGVDKETIYTCYVIDSNRKLIGIVSAKSLLLSEEDSIIEDIMETNLIFVHTLEDQEEAANILKKYDLLAVPVVDDEQRLVGIVTIDDAMDVLEEETTEDFARIAGITPSDKPYFKTSVYETWKARIPWLLILMISATFTSMIINSYDSAMKQYLVLTAFMPMLMGTGGNSGNQSSVTIIRAISLGDIDFKDIFKVLFKETRVALLAGVTLAVCNYFKLIFFDKIEQPVALVICLSLVLIVLFAKMLGSILPILIKKMGLDPAVMASPFITTVIDVLSLFVYFQIASAILHV